MIKEKEVKIDRIIAVISHTDYKELLLVSKISYL